MLPHAAPDTIVRMARAAEMRSFGALSRIEVSRNGRAWSAVAILTGQAAVLQESDDGRQAIAFVAPAGMLVGMPPAVALPVPFDLLGLTNGEAAAWHGPEIQELAGADGGLARDLLDHAIAWTAELLRTVEAMTFASARRRLARALLLHADLTLHPERPPLSRPQLAALIGASREMTGRVLTQLEAAGSIQRVGRSGLAIVDWRAIQHEAGLDPPLDKRDRARED